MSFQREKALAPSREADQFVLRFPPGLRDKVKRRAEVNRRSMNNELVVRVENSLKAEEMIEQGGAQ